MSDQQIAIIALFLGPIGAILATMITVRVQRRNAMDENKLGVGEVAVSKKEAATNEFSALVDGFNTSFREMRIQIDELKGRVGSLEEVKLSLQGKVENLSADNSLLRQEVAEITLERARILEHLKSVEELVPSPPGPPARSF